MTELELVAPDDPRVETIWRALEPRGPASYFMSWGWIDSWLAMLPRSAAPSLAVIHDGGAPVAAAFIGRRRVTRHRVVSSRSWFLHGTGVPRFDELCAEHVRAVGDPRGLAAILSRLPGRWDEIVLRAIDRETADALGAFPLRVDREVASPFVDLARVRAAPGGYLSLLGANARAQIRRAQRELGELAVEVAVDVAHAADIYDELVQLHAARWQARGEPGAFADSWFDAFHRRLIARRIGTGEIELVRVRAGPRTIGCLYNLVHRGNVAFYQSGLAAAVGPHDKPGLVCHAAAIAHAARAGHAVYDFLAGDSQYKRSLATDAAHLVWARVQRPRARFAVEDWLRARRPAVRAALARQLHPHDGMTTPQTPAPPAPAAPDTNHATTWADVQRTADELELKIHLAGMEVRDRWEKLQPRVAKLEQSIARSGARAGELLAEELATVGAALRRLRDDMMKPSGR